MLSTRSNSNTRIRVPEHYPVVESTAEAEKATENWIQIQPPGADANVHSVVPGFGFRDPGTGLCGVLSTGFRPKTF